MRLSSSRESWPNSDAHSRPSASNARPSMLRCPYDQTLLSNGLPLAARPSLSSRRIEPFGPSRSWASSGTAPSPTGEEQVAGVVEQQPSTVVVGRRPDAGEQRLGLAELVALHREPHEPIVRAGAHVRVQDRLVVWIQRDAHQAALAGRRVSAVDGAEVGDLAVRIDAHDRAGVALRHVRGTAGEERDAPRDVQSGGDRRLDLGVHRPARRWWQVAWSVVGDGVLGFVVAAAADQRGGADRCNTGQERSTFDHGIDHARSGQVGHNEL